MSTSSNTLPSATSEAPEALRLHVANEASSDRVDGSWWPRSRDLQREAADLVDHFPASYGRISRLLFSRPDWDNSSTDGRGVRSIRAARGTVKVGSFPSDDTRLMILTMSNGRRLKLRVIPSDTPETEAQERLEAGSGGAESAPDVTSASDRTTDWARWDNESPAE